MKKNVVKTILIIYITILWIFSLSFSNTYATTIGDIFTKADEFVQAGESNNGSSGIPEDSIQTMSDILYNVLLIIGIVIAVGVGIVLGIQFMTGGIEEKAKVKETLIPYVAGCVVLFGAFTIWKVVVLLLQNT